MRHPPRDDYSGPHNTTVGEVLIAGGLHGEYYYASCSCGWTGDKWASWRHAHNDAEEHVATSEQK